MNAIIMNEEIVDAYCTLGNERETMLSADELIKQMDRAGIARAIVAPDDREIAVHNKQGNRRILEECQASNGRFIPACTVNPWYGRVACEELQAAISAGARMLVLAPALQGFCLSDTLLDDLLVVAAQRRVPVYVHTGPHSSSAPTQLVLVANKHSTVRFIVGHCGSTDYANDMPFVFSCGLANLWFELSLVRPWAIANYYKLGGDSKLLFASAAPRNDATVEMRHLASHLPKEAYSAIFGQNIVQLLAEVKQ